LPTEWIEKNDQVTIRGWFPVRDGSISFSIMLMLDLSHFGEMPVLRQLARDFRICAPQIPRRAGAGEMTILFKYRISRFQ
jgi:hypothetical protein